MNCDNTEVKGPLKYFFSVSEGHRWAVVSVSCASLRWRATKVEHIGENSTFSHNRGIFVNLRRLEVNLGPRFNQRLAHHK